MELIKGRERGWDRRTRRERAKDELEVGSFGGSLAFERRSGKTDRDLEFRTRKKRLGE